MKTLDVNKRVNFFIELGILPHKNFIELSDIQKNIYNDISISYTDLDLLVYKYLNHANTSTKRLYVHKKIKNKSRSSYHIKKGYAFNVLKEDIIMNECCPFFGTKILYSGGIGKGAGKTFHDPFLYSIDRIDNSKGYVNGNVWIISRLANSIKLDSTMDELKKFCKNVILIHSKT